MHTLNYHQIAGISGFGSDMTGDGRKRSDWNIYLLENVFAPAYGRLLEKFDTLFGLPLLPLANGSFTLVDNKGVGERVYIARGDEYGLLKDSIPYQLVINAIPEEVHKKLCYIVPTDSTNISFLSCHVLEKLLVKLLPVERLATYAYEEVSRAYGVYKDLQEFKDTLSIIRGLLLDAEYQKDQKHGLREWMRQLQNICYDAEDVFDGFEFQHKRKQVVQASNSTRTKHC
ncbi:hypothetical protein KIW84_012352 [Lathyrus oleraceus]|uniref:Disease resistance N-terminal domain-containing protein n=1 Tax=Pisum sativum TaxID=3888 RepID=A0A9D5BHK9_PEA|nr:hypothetical protein KIW84_012352 [Pisum sativum]